MRPVIKPESIRLWFCLVAIAVQSGTACYALDPITLATWQGFPIRIGPYDAVNHRIQMVGYATSCAGTASVCARLWEYANGPENPFTLGADAGVDRSGALAIDASQFPTPVYGWILDPSAPSASNAPEVWTKNPAPPPLSAHSQLLPLAGGRGGEANDINAGGMIVGSCLDAAQHKHACLWPTQNSVPQDLGTLGGLESEGWRINVAGTIVGWAQDASGARHAFRYDYILGRNKTTIPVMRDIHPAGYTSSTGLAINDVGSIVGEVQADQGTQAGLWDAQKGFVQLPNSGATASARGINNIGLIVGYTKVFPANGLRGVSTAVFWMPALIVSPKSALYVLQPASAFLSSGSKTVTLTGCNDVNDRGDMACYGLSHDGPLSGEHAYLLLGTP
jgi:probable HAF family extracellular repeat protein